MPVERVRTFFREEEEHVPEGGTEEDWTPAPQKDTIE
jgi:hypothetical protein